MANVWVKFADLAAFQTYAAQACAAAGIPKPGQNQATGQTDLAACWTTALVQPLADGLTEVKDAKGMVTGYTGTPTIVANVPQADVALYKLTPYLLRSSKQPATFTPIYQPKPTTWQGQPVPADTPITTTTT